MKSKIFNSDQIRAIQDGRMTQFMQVVKPQPCSMAEKGGAGFAWSEKGPDSSSYKWNTNMQSLGNHMAEESPFGKVGDVIAVKETWVKGIIIDENEKTVHEGTLQFWYKADNNAPEWYRPELSDDHPNYLTPPWKSPSTMPREAARLFLRITNIRVMRVQELTEEDAKAQGYEVIDDEFCPALCALKSEVFEKGLDYFEKYHWIIDFEKTDKP